MHKTLVITGASKGIGYATAEHFLQRDYKIINLSRHPCCLQSAHNIAIDLLDRNWPQAHQKTLLDAVAEPDELVVIHNAAMMTKDSVTDIQANVLRDVLQLNVVAAAQLNSLLLPLMRPASSILYVSSTLGSKAVANTHAYVISKHAVIGQMRATCQDLAGSLIHTACVSPGFTETEMLQSHLGKNPKILNSITSTIAHNRLVQPEEIAQTLWFCSQNPVLNGSVIEANLGQIER